MENMFSNTGGGLRGLDRARERVSATPAASHAQGLFNKPTSSGGNAWGQGDRSLWGDHNGWGRQAAANNPFGDRFQSTAQDNPWGGSVWDEGRPAAEAPSGAAADAVPALSLNGSDPAQFWDAFGPPRTGVPQPIAPTGTPDTRFSPNWDAAQKWAQASYGTSLPPALMQYFR